MDFPIEYQQSLEQELRETFAGQEGLLYNMLLYQLGWMDEQGMPISGDSVDRHHALLCLLTCESLLGDYAPALPAGAAVELVHNFTLIHEDVHSGNPHRGRRPNVWWIWGPGQAINAGDGMHALARLALMRLEGRGLSGARVLDAMRLLDQACLSMCEGQYMDLAFQEKVDVGIESYMKMAAGKAGALTSCAMGLGALVAAEDNGIIESFKECGVNLGIAHQIMQDIDEIEGSVSEESLSSNVLIKKKLLPIVHTLTTGEPSTRRELGTIYFKRVLEPRDVQHVVNILKESSALDFARNKAQEYCQTAIASLEGVEMPSDGRDRLTKLCWSVIERERQQ